MQRTERALFEQTVSRDYGKLLGFVRHRVADESAAEDILQDALLDAHRSLPSYRGDTELAGWVFGIIHNKVRRYYRSQALVRRLLVTTDDGPSTVSGNDNPEHLLSQSQRLERLETLIEELDDDTRRALLTVSLDGLPYAEASSLLNITSTTLRCRLLRTRRRLLRGLDEAGLGLGD